eukprot:179020-Amphidinium_carterae.2
MFLYVSQQAHPAAEEQPTPPKRGGGGAYRAYIHVHAKRRKLTKEDMTELSSAYRALSKEEHAYYQALGKQATQLHAAGAHAFPASSERAVRRRAGGAAASSGAVVAAGKVERQGFAPEDFEETLLRGEVPLHVDHMTKDDITRIVSNLARRIRAGKKSQEEAARATEKEVLQKSLRDGDDFIAQRALLGQTTLCRWLAHTVTDSCKAFMAVHTPDRWSSPAQEETRHMTAFEDAWRIRHRGVSHTSWQHPEPKTQQKRCLQQGHCICKGQGRKAHSIVLSVQKFFRHLASTDPSKEQLLVDGFGMLQWQSQEASTGEVGTSAFCYMPFVNKRPWRIYIMRCQPCNIDAASAALPWKPAQRPKEPLEFSFPAPDSTPIEPLHAFIASFDLSKDWHVQLWMLSRRHIAVTSVVKSLWAQALDMDARQVWNSQHGRGQVHPKKPLHQLADEGVGDRRGIARASARSTASSVSVPRNIAEELSEEEEEDEDAEDEDCEEGSGEHTIEAEMGALTEAAASNSRNESSHSSESSSSSSSSDSGSSSSSSDTKAPDAPAEAAGSGAAASSAAPASSAEPPDMPDNVRARRREATEGIRVLSDDGRLRAHIRINASLDNFYAVCSTHVECVKTRTYKEGRQRGSGRPLGFLAAWAREANNYPDKVSHMTACRPDYESRLQARVMLEREPNAAGFFALERPPLPVENGREPPEVPKR